MMKKKCLTPESVFVVAALFGIAVMFVMLWLSNGAAMPVMGYEESISCDFWGHIERLLKYERLYGNPNDANAIFPPLAYCFLQLFAQCFRSAGRDSNIAVTGYGILVLNMYLLTFMTAFTLMLHYSYKTKSTLFKILMPFIFLFSYPFWSFAFERGNPVIYAMLFLYAGLAMRDHTNKTVRELSLICIAVAAGFKIYPAIFGLLWIKEKRYKESLRLLLYGILLFFVPFVFFGGLQGLADYVQSFFRYLGKDVYSGTSIVGSCIKMFGEQGKAVGKIIIFLWLLWVALCLLTRGGIHGKQLHC